MLPLGCESCPQNIFNMNAIECIKKQSDLCKTDGVLFVSILGMPRNFDRDLGYVV